MRSTWININFCSRKGHLKDRSHAKYKVQEPKGTLLEKDAPYMGAGKCYKCPCKAFDKVPGSDYCTCGHNYSDHGLF